MTAPAYPPREGGPHDTAPRQCHRDDASGAAALRRVESASAWLEAQRRERADAWLAKMREFEDSRLPPLVMLDPRTVKFWLWWVVAVAVVALYLLLATFVLPGVPT